MATACNVPEFTLLSTTATFDCTPTPFCKANQCQFPVDASAFLMVATTLSFQNETDCRCNACIRIMRNSLPSQTAYWRAICGAPRLASAIPFFNALNFLCFQLTIFFSDGEAARCGGIRSALPRARMSIFKHRMFRASVLRCIPNACAARL